MKNISRMTVLSVSVAILFLAVSAQTALQILNNNTARFLGNIEVNQDKQIYKTDVNNNPKNTYDALPVGTILMFDGSGWVDNETVPGWYACSKANENKKIGTVNIPNLEDRFMKGTFASETVGTLHNVNDKSLTLGQLPNHDHDLTHNHPPVNTTDPNEIIKHTHTVTILKKSPVILGPMGTGMGYNKSTGSNAVIDLEYEDKKSSDNSVFHNHKVDLPSITNTTTKAGNGANIDFRPAYYNVIYIKKCANVVTQ